MLTNFHSSISPLVRGSLFYITYWGAVAIYAPFLNVYFRQLGFSGRQIGVLALLSPLLTLFLAMPLSALADRRRWRVRLLIGMLGGYALVLFWANFAQTFTVWVPLMITMALFLSPIASLADSLIARMAIRHNLNYGTMRLWGSFGFAVISIICGVIWERLGFGVMFMVASLSFVPVLFFATMLVLYLKFATS